MIKEVLRNHSKKLLLIISAVLVLAALIVFAAVTVMHISQDNTQPKISAILSYDGKSAEVELYKSDNGYYFLLPSYVTLSQCKLSLSEAYILEIGEKTFVDGDDISEIMNLTQENMRLLSEEAEVFSSNFYVLKAENTAAIHINTQSGNIDYIHTNKENKETGEMLYVSADGEVIYDGQLDYIKGRGNKSFRDSEKKPYNIKLNKSTDLLGTGQSKRWSLIANYFDQSGIRNKLVYDFAKESGLSFTPDCEIVDLYLNGQYAGTYTLCERIETGEGRVDIDNLEKVTEGLNVIPVSTASAITEENRKYYDIAANPQNITGGYIVELEFTTRYKSESSWFITDGGLAVVFASPEYVSKAQMEYVSSLVQEFEDALYAENGINPETGKSWEEYIDVTSWAQKYLIEEIFCNQDMEWSSQYLYIKKDEYKLYAGPVWDYDFSIGNGDSCLENPETLVSTWRGTAFDSYSHWLPELLKKDSFMSEVKKIYVDTMRPLCDEYIEKITQYADKYKNSAAMNELIWYGGQNAAEEDILKLKEYFKTHIDFLDSLWIDGKDYVFITFATSVPENTAWLFAVKRGEIFEKIPVPEEVEGDEFLGWFVEETGEEYFSGMTITKDIRIIGRWKSQEE